MAVTRRVRFEILRRDNHTCRYCGGQPPEVKLTVDHVIPVALGGGDDPSNLVTACQACNAGKSSTAPDQAVIADVDETAMRFAAALEMAAQMRRSAITEQQAHIRTFDEGWCSWRWGDDHNLVPRDDDWLASVERWLALGMTGEELVHFTRVAMQSHVDVERTWKYFCGCVWGELKERQELAKRLIDEGRA